MYPITKFRCIAVKGNKIKKYISLFSGIGGLDEGLHKAGFQPLACSELDPNATLTLKQWLLSKNITAKVYGDINMIDPDVLRDDLGLIKGELDLLAGGPPCQSFSLMGKRNSLGDHRGLLLFKMFHFAEAFMPKSIIIEQVKGLLSSPGHDGKKGGALKGLLDDLRRIGYLVNYKVLCAADYGVPQLRERVFIVATKNVDFSFPPATHRNLKNSSNLDLDFCKQTSRYTTVRDVIADLPRPVKKGETAYISSHIDVTPARDSERIHGVPEGQCLAKQLHLPQDQRMRLTSKDTTKFRRLSWDEPSLTLRGGEAFYHPEEDRYLTPREYMRIHGFDDDHILIGPIRSRTGNVRELDQHRLVANSVPPKLSEILGKELLKQIL